MVSAATPSSVIRGGGGGRTTGGGRVTTPAVARAGSRRSLKRNGLRDGAVKGGSWTRCTCSRAASFSMSICEVLTCGTRAAGAAAGAGVEVGGIEKNHVARMPAPEITAVDFQSMLERNMVILTFRSSRPAAAPLAACTLPRSRLSSLSLFAVQFGLSEGDQKG